MKKTPITAKNAKPVADLVHGILEQGRHAKADGPFSGLYGREAQMSTALTQAGTLLAKLDRAQPAKRSTVLNAILGTQTHSKPKPPKRSWFFASKAEPAMPDAKRIEQLLRAAQKDGRPLVLDRDPSQLNAGASDVECHLPEGAVDPVCMPR